MALITCKNASFGYEGTPVIEGLDFEIQEGDYVCIVGENGAGKSTLIKGMLNLLPPMAGTVSSGDGLHANEIGYLPQQTAAQKDFPASVREVVLSGRLSSRGIRPFYSREDKAIAEQNMERLGLMPLQKRCYRELSGGQQQRVLLARALCATRKVLLLDEPVSGLDPIVSQEMYAMIAEINRELGTTILMVSHDVQSAVQHASHILHVNRRQLFYGDTKAYASTELGHYFLEGKRHD